MRVALGEVVGELLAFDVDIGKGSTERRGQLPCTVSEQDEDQDGDAEQPDRALGARRRGRNTQPDRTDQTSDHDVDHRPETQSTPGRPADSRTDRANPQAPN